MAVQKVNQRSTQLIESERGSAGLSALFGAVVTMTLVLALREYLTNQLEPTLMLALTAALCTVSLFCFGAGLHLFLLGSRTTGAIHQDVDRRLRLLQDLRWSVKEFLDYSNWVINRSSGVLAPKAIQNIRQLERLSRAMEEREGYVRHVLSARTPEALIEADAYLQHELTVTENCMNSLIQDDPMPALTIDEWNKRIREMTREIEEGLSQLSQFPPGVQATTATS